LGQKVADLTLQVGRHALQAANRHRFSIHAGAAAGRFAGTVTRAAEDAGKYVRFPVHHVGFRVLTLRDQPDIFRNIGVSGASPLAIDDLVVVTRIVSIRPLQTSSWDTQASEVVYRKTIVTLSMARTKVSLYGWRTILYIKPNYGKPCQNNSEI